METAAFRIVQEALTNIAQHAVTGEAAVQVWADDRTLGIRVADQGVGFDLESILLRQTSSGLASMHEWAASSGGALHVESAPGSGTCVTATLPLETRAEDEQTSPPLEPVLSGRSPAEARQRRRQQAAHTAPATSILLAEGHSLIRQGLRSLLEAGPGFSLVGEAATGWDAVAMTERLRPNLLVLDLALPGLGGLEVTRQVVARAPDTKVLVMSPYTEEAYLMDALGSGATGYALKESSAEDLVQAAQAVAAGRRYLSPAFSERAIEIYMALRKSSEGTLDSFSTLTSREREVLQLIAEGHKNTEIAEMLTISPRTTETHRSNLMRKLGLHSTADLVRYALHRGIISLDG